MKHLTDQDWLDISLEFEKKQIVHTVLEELMENTLDWLIRGDQVVNTNYKKYFSIVLLAVADTNNTASGTLMLGPMGTKEIQTY